MFTVVGAGFGLYGYVPALIESFGPLVLPEDYRAKILARPELAPLADRIRWARDREAALEQASGVVIAVPPESQPEVVARCLALASIERLVLEKPLAPTPALAAELSRRLAASGKRYRVGYSILHTASTSAPWPAAGEIEIEWTFMAHHFARGLDNWKRSHARGGGPLRFYGIHLIALLARQGYDGVERSALEGPADEPRVWHARFTGPGLPPCAVRVDSMAQAPLFRISVRDGGSEKALVDVADPFDAPADPAGQDRRVAVLVRLLSTFAEPDAPYHDLYERTNALWSRVEQAHAR